MLGGTVRTSAQDAANESIGAASALAAQAPPEAGASLLSAASDAFTSAMGVGLTVGAALAALTAVVVARLLPGLASRPKSEAAHGAAPEGARVADHPGVL